MTRYDTYYSSDSTNQLLSFVCGAIVGAAAALLFAPMRGQEMRASIGDAARQGRSRLREYSDAGRSWAQDQASAAGDAIRDSASRLRSSADDALEGVRSSVDRGSDRAEDALDRAGDALDRAVENTRSNVHNQSDFSSTTPSGDPLTGTRNAERWP